MVDMDEPRWVREAREQKKWAFVADFYRMAFMYQHGGITLDADVELLKPLDQFLIHDFFSGQEINGKVLITATMGSVREHPFVGMALDYYRLMPFKQSPNTKFLTNLIRLLDPVTHESSAMTFPRGMLYPQETFCPYDHRKRVAIPTANTYTIHHFSGSWLTCRKSPESISG